MKEWFRARTIWGAAIDTLSDAEAGRLMKALWHYAMSGEQPNLSGAEKSIMALILMTLSQDDARDASVSEKRAAAGSAGGKQRVANQANAKFAKGKVANEANAYSQSQNQNNYMDDDDDDDVDLPRARGEDAAEMEYGEWKTAVTSAIEGQMGRKATPAEVTQIAVRAKLHGLSPVMAALAIKRAAENGAQNMIRYTSEIFSEWDSEYVKTPEEAEELRTMYFATKGSGGIYTLESHEEVARMQEARERRKAAHEAEVMGG